MKNVINNVINNIILKSNRLCNHIFCHIIFYLTLLLPVPHLCCLLLTIVAHYSPQTYSCPLLNTVACYAPLLPVTHHCCVLLTIVACYSPLLCVTHHCCLLLTIVASYSPQSPVYSPQMLIYSPMSHHRCLLTHLRGEYLVCCTLVIYGMTKLEADLIFLFTGLSDDPHLIGKFLSKQ